MQRLTRDADNTCPIIALRGVRVVRDARAVLDGIDLTLASPRVGIIGDNGSGKTTLARVVAGLIAPDAGHVTLDGVAIAGVSPRIGLVFQEPDHQIVMPTVGEDLAFGLVNQRVPKAEIAARVADMLTRFGWQGREHWPAHLLSGGEKKLLSLMSVLIMAPDVILFDEPLAGLDLKNRRAIAAIIAGLPHMVIAISHDLDSLADYDRVVWLADGRVVADGPPGVIIPRYLAAEAPCSPFIATARA